MQVVGEGTRLVKAEECAWVHQASLGGKGLGSRWLWAFGVWDGEVQKDNK